MNGARLSRWTGRASTGSILCSHHGVLTAGCDADSQQVSDSPAEELCVAHGLYGSLSVRRQHGSDGSNLRRFDVLYMKFLTFERMHGDFAT